MRFHTIRSTKWPEKKRIPVRLGLIALVSVVLLIVGGCAIPKVRFGYVATGEGIIAFRVDAGTGAASQVFGSPFVAATSPGVAASNSSVLVHPNGRFVYAADQDINNISLFQIDPTTGALTEVRPRTPLVTSSGMVGLSPAVMAMDKDGKYLFVANQVTSDIWVFSIGSSGALTFVSSAPLAASPSWLTLSSSGNLLYVTVPDVSAIYAFSVSSGALTQIGTPFVVSGGVGKVAIDPNENFLYVPNPAIDTVTVLRIHSDGSLGLGSGAYATGTTPIAAVTSPTGVYLYVANSGSANLSLFQVNTTTGQLAVLTSAPIPTGTEPSSLVIDPQAKFFFVVNQQGNSISEYLFNSNGTLYSVGNSIHLSVLPRSFSITP
ncbi:MAG TPA: beta-propeller fold lactonase family protein [Terriglobales bacterium]|nr:beta-propeller fold lactonase family protein [Terriglobales bacterium]